MAPWRPLVFTFLVAGMCHARTAESWIAEIRSGTPQNALSLGVRYEGLDSGPETGRRLRQCLSVEASAVIRAACAAALGDLGSELSLDIPALIGALSDTDELVRAHATLALAKKGDSAVPDLMKSIEFQRPDFRTELSEPNREKTDALSFFGGEFHGWLPAFLSALTLGEIPSAVQPMLVKLGEEPAGSRRPRMVSPMVLGDRNSGAVYWYAEFGLTRSGAKMFPSIAKLLSGAEVHTQERLLRILANPELASGLTKQDVPLIERCLSSRDQEISRLAAELLARAGPEARSLLRARAKGSDLQRSVVFSLADSGHFDDALRFTSRGFAPAVRAAVMSEIRNSQRSLSFESKGAAGRKYPAAVFVAALDALDDPDADVSREAASLIEDIQILAEPVPEAEIQSVLARLKLHLSPKDDRLTAALSGYQVLGERAAPLRPQVVALLKDTRVYLTHEMLTALAGAGEDEVVVAAIRDFFERANDLGKADSARLLMSWGQTPLDLAAKLERLYDKNPELVNVAIARLLGDLGSAGHRGLQRLTQREIASAAQILAETAGTEEDARVAASAITSKQSSVAVAAIDGLAARTRALPAAASIRTGLARALDRLNDEHAIRAHAGLGEEGKSSLLGLLSKYRKGTSLYEIERVHWVIETLLRMDNGLVTSKPIQDAFNGEVASSWLLEMAGRLRGFPGIANNLAYRCLSESPGLRARAIDFLAQAEGLTFEEKHAFAIQSFVLHFVSDSLYRFERDIDKYFPVYVAGPAGPLHSDNREPQASSFPWPLPLPSERENITTLFGQGVRLRGVDSQLREALVATGYGAGGLFEVKGGFVRVAKLEQVDTNRIAVPEPYRFVSMHVPPKSLVDYLAQLFIGRPGFFRLLVFAVVDKLEVNEAASMNEDAARRYYVSGSDDPHLIPVGPLAEKQVFALIYEFEKTLTGKIVPIPSPKSTREQLQNAGLWALLSKR